MEDKDLLAEAQKAKGNAYAPYSGFRVGAAVLTREGRVFHGCNVENASFGVTNCAERTALFSAVAAGKKDVASIAIVSDDEHFTAPCGVCRQALVEFNPDMKVIMGNAAGEYVTKTAADLLPMYFSLDKRSV